MNKKKEKNLRSLMITDLESRLLPVFIDKGFWHVSLPPEEISRDTKRGFPLGRLKRKSGTELDIIEFQFEIHGEPQFVINFGTVPETGVTLPWGKHVIQNLVGANSLPISYRLHSSPVAWILFGPYFGPNWFGPGFFSRKNKQAITRAVDKALLLSGEVINWFETKAIGKHVEICDGPGHSRDAKE